MAKTNLLNSIKLKAPGKNRFDLTHDVKMSLNPGLLYPTLALECVPGDSFRIGCDSLFRSAPMVAPMMHRVDVTMHYFFCPLRLLWENWEDYITNTDDGSGLPVHPFINIDENNYNKLMDYMGIPIPSTSLVERVNAFPFAAYQLIWNEFYRDQNLIDDISELIELVDGANPEEELLKIRRRAWEHDYFTSALPFAQKGAAVELPVVADFEDLPLRYNSNVDVLLSTNLGDRQVQDGTPDPALPLDWFYTPTSELDVEATTINDLRIAFRLQEWLEKSARGGSRYAENILSFFNVKPQDFRLNRPEYITGTKSPIIISEVLNTTGTPDAAQGEMAGHGVSVTQGKYGSYFCQEHGYIIGIVSIMPKTAYQQGIPRHFLKTNDPFEYFWPQFAHVGEQEIYNSEIYAWEAEGRDTFGYIPRYAEYKYIDNRVAGDFRTNLDFWHWGRIFSVLPQLNQQFIECNPDYRVFAVTDPEVDHYYAHILHNIQAVRPMPKFGTPTF